MARANKKKLSDIANESDAKYDKVKLQAAAITETFTEDDDGPGHNEEALVYLKLKLEDIVDDINVLATDVVDPNTAKTGITSTQADRITANHAKVGITTRQASEISANTSKTGITSTQAGHITTNNAKTGITSTQAGHITTNNNKVGFVTTMPTATEGHTVSLSVTNSRGAYALVFTMVDRSGKTAVTKTATIALE
tara:strand:- start:4546 stop:5133 length:588 start_codon:yes stop_codon:yes gene_type:complete